MIEHVPFIMATESLRQKNEKQKQHAAFSDNQAIEEANKYSSPQPTRRKTLKECLSLKVEETRG